MVISPESVAHCFGLVFRKQDRKPPRWAVALCAIEFAYRFFLARLGAAFLETFFLAELVLDNFFLKAWPHPSAYFSVEPTRTIDIFVVPL